MIENAIILGGSIILWSAIVALSALAIAIVGNIVADFHRAGVERVRKAKESGRL